MPTGLLALSSIIQHTRQSNLCTTRRAGLHKTSAIPSDVMYTRHSLAVPQALDKTIEGVNGLDHEVGAMFAYELDIFRLSQNACCFCGCVDHRSILPSKP